MSAPKAFYSYMENEEKLNMLSDEQAGRLYKALYAYSRTGERPDMSDDPLLNYALADFLIDVDRDREKYEQTCKRRSEAGRKGGKASASNKEAKEAKACSNEAKEANACFAKQKEAKASKSSETEAEAETEDNIAGAILSKGARPDFDERAYRVIEHFRRICTGFIQPDKLTAYRKRLIYQAEQDGVDFELLFKKAQASKFLSNSKGIGIDWVLTPKNTQKILEGNYDKEFKPPDKHGGKGSAFSLEGASFDISKYEKDTLFDD